MPLLNRKLIATFCSSRLGIVLILRSVQNKKALFDILLNKIIPIHKINMFPKIVTLFKHDPFHKSFISFTRTLIYKFSFRPTVLMIVKLKRSINSRQVLIIYQNFRLNFKFIKTNSHLVSTSKLSC